MSKRRRARSKARKKLEQQSVDENNANLESSSNKQGPSDAQTVTDTLMQVDSTDLFLFAEHQNRDSVSTTSAPLGVESAANMLSIKPKELDVNPMENHLEKNLAEKKKKKRKKKKKKKNKMISTAAMSDLQATPPKAESAVQLPAPELQDVDMNLADNLEVTPPKAESAVQLLAPEIQDVDMNLADNLEVKSANGKWKRRKKKTKTTSNVLDVDSNAKLLTPKHQVRDANLMKDTEEKSASGENSANGKKKRRRRKKNLNKPASSAVNAESTAEVLVLGHQETDTSSTKDLEEKSENGRKRKRGENISKSTSDAQHVQITAQSPAFENQEKKKRRKKRKVKKAANNKIDDVKTATQGSLSSGREETEALCAGSVNEGVNFVSVQTEHKHTPNGSYLTFSEKNSGESCREGTHLPSSAEVTMHVGAHPRRKLLILDLNGLLADIVMPPPKGVTADARFSRRAIFKRPFCDDFLKFCFERFYVGIWSSRTKKIIDGVIDYLLGDLKHKLIFCWDMSHSTKTKFNTLENKHKPLVFKDLRKIWKKYYPAYDESNTLLLDDSPYKALLSPAHSTIFPYSYNFKLKNDKSLGPGGNLRVYLEKLADAEHVQKFVEQHPFGQRAIDEKSSNWKFYSKVIKSISSSG